MALIGALLVATGASGEEVPTPPVGAIACVACRLEVSSLLARYDDEEWASLRKGRILIEPERVEEGDGRAVGRTLASALIQHRPEQVWSVLTDFETWPGFMPLILETNVVKRESDRIWVRQRYRVFWSKMEHTTIYESAPEAGILRWQLDEEAANDIAASEGRWQFVPVDSGRHTLIRYRARMDAGRAVPGFVEDLLMKRSLHDLLSSLREETERRYTRSAKGR